MKNGALLVNLGTPDSPQPADVKKYLKEFLMDPYVVDIPYPMRWALVNLVIAPRRSVDSGKRYENIWTDQGSPLLFYHHALGREVQSALQNEKEDILVLTAMRYGNPSIKSALNKFKKAGTERVVLIPMYPQYSLAATESTLQKVAEEMKHTNSKFDLVTINDFYDDSRFIDAFVEIGKEEMEKDIFDHYVFSFHGLPERHVKKTDPTQSHCLTSNSCCDHIIDANRMCYRAQSYCTARLIAQKLQISPKDYSVAFQSRLGRTPWIRPFTDELFESLPKAGHKKVCVFVPSFVADCLETLEEITIRGNEIFRRSGGTNLHLVPSLNAHPKWVRGVRSMILEKLDLTSSSANAGAREANASRPDQ